MDPQLFAALLASTDSLQTLFEHLVRNIWTRESFERANNLEREYLEANEILASNLERDLYNSYFDIYQVLESPHPLKKRALNLLEQRCFTLLIFDALSLREIPALQRVLEEHGIVTTVDFALAG